MKKRCLTIIILIIVIIACAWVILRQTLPSGNQEALAVNSYTLVDGVTNIVTPNSTECGDNLIFGTATQNNLKMTLQPNTPVIVRWDFTNCLAGIQNFTVYASQPRSKGGRMSALSPSTRLTMTGKNVTTDEPSYSRGFIQDFGYADHSVVEVYLKNTGSKPLDIQITHSEAIGGEPIR